ncbi:MAG: COQ9 family protein, partial [Rhodospirillales bacterium]|nr:COQ9 family protein [Rhodospirillales bacterium]
MIGLPERSEARDAALLASLAHVPELGWTRAALRAGLRDIGADPRDADMLFPGGGRDLIETFVDMADRRMAEAA